MAELAEIQNLIQALKGETDQRKQAQTRLVELGEMAIEPLIETVRAGNGRATWAAAEVLGELADPRAFPTLVGALRSDDLLLSGIALKGLLAYEDQDILPYLLEALPYVHIMTQQNIVLALQRLADNRSVNDLIEQLDQIDSPTIRTAIIQTLGKIGDPAAIPAIRACLNDADHHVREWAVTAIKQLGNIPE